MKNPARLLFLIALTPLFFSATSLAQVSVGLRGGVNFANLDMRGPEVLPFKPKISPSFAVLFNIPVGNAMSIQIEPGFSQRGGRITQSESGVVNGVSFKVEAETSLSINYIEMPILYQYRPKLGKLEGIVSLGPEWRVMTGGMKLEQSSKQTVNGEVVEEASEEATLNGDDAFKRFDYGLAGGVGIAFPIGNIRLFGEGRYHFGLKNLNDPNVDPKAYNRGASVHIGVLFAVGK
jgi:hypothetical protein